MGRSHRESWVLEPHRVNADSNPALTIRRAVRLGDIVGPTQRVSDGLVRTERRSASVQRHAINDAANARDDHSVGSQPGAGRNGCLRCRNLQEAFRTEEGSVRRVRDGATSLRQAIRRDGEARQILCEFRGCGGKSFRLAWRNRRPARGSSVGRCYGSALNRSVWAGCLLKNSSIAYSAESAAGTRASVCHDPFCRVTVSEKSARSSTAAAPAVVTSIST